MMGSIQNVINVIPHVPSAQVQQSTTANSVHRTITYRKPLVFLAISVAFFVQISQFTVRLVNRDSC